VLKRLAFGFLVLCLIVAAALVYVDGHVPAAVPDGEGALDYRPFAKALQHVGASGLVDYAALKNDRAGLDAFVAQLARVSPLNHPEQFDTPDDRLAFWLNAYHALVLQAGLDQDAGAQLDGIGRRFYWARSWPIGGRRFTLWAVERRFLAETGDSRIPFALGCGAKGCALLDGSPFQADTLDAQLNDAVGRFVQSERNVKLKPDGIYLSPLFRIHEADIRAALPEGRTNVLQFVWAFLPEVCLDRPGCDTRGDLDKACGPKLEGCPLKYVPFDWQLAARP
jgi:hypothetical protein